MFEVSKIKLIIWDLDETLWKGTLSEGDVEFSEMLRIFLADTLDRGIMNSICSKNDYQKAKEKLEEFNIWHDFVFQSIDWAAKGARVKSIIERMSLRDENVLFIDDNRSNLNEAIFSCPNIMTAEPKDLNTLIRVINTLSVKDKEHNRLKQYRLLENKENAKAGYISNEAFLLSSSIRAEIYYDCYNHIDRIADLIQRSNQLNYTKNRMTIEEIHQLLNDMSVKSGYITVSDRYGDYGIVGFYAISQEKLVHFVFSCRTLGMRVEQWTYMKIGCPQITVIGDVVTQLNSTEYPKWINQSTNVRANEKKEKINEIIVFKGPCDMEQIFSFINTSDNIVSEFTYVSSKGKSVEGYNHTAQIYSSLTMTQATKNTLLSKYAWVDNREFDTILSKETPTNVVLSLLTDGNLGVYKHRATKTYIAMCERYYDITDKNNREAYLNNNVFTSGVKFTEQVLDEISNDFEYIDNSDGLLTIECLDKIYSITAEKCNKFILLLGSERDVAFSDVKPAYMDRGLFHTIMNKRVREWAVGKNNVVLLSFDDYIHSEDDYVDTINHFVKRVYYELAQDIVKLINNKQVTGKGTKSIARQEFMQKVKRSKWYIDFAHPIVKYLRSVRARFAGSN